MSYSDALVDINEQSIRLKHYYFPFGSRRVPFSEIIAVVVKEPTLLNGKWRLWGSGNLCTWFPPDLRRPWRDSIFIIQLASGWRRIGFTVEDSGRVRQILSEMGLLAAPCLWPATRGRLVSQRAESAVSRQETGGAGNGSG